MNRDLETTALGIVVLSASLHLLHMNRQAMDLLTRVAPAAPRVGTAPTLVAPLHQPCQEIVESLQNRLAGNNWAQFRQDRTIGTARSTIAVKGFGLPNPRGLAHSRIVLLLAPPSPAVMPDTSGMESSDRIPEGIHTSADLPQAIGM